MTAADLRQQTEDFVSKELARSGPYSPESQQRMRYTVCAKLAEFALERAKTIKVTDQDSISVSYGTLIKFHENGFASHVKLTLDLTRHQMKNLLRSMLEACDVDPEQDDLGALNLAWIWED